MLAETQGRFDAAILAAFGDPGLLGARELFDFPVIGVSEAAMLTACMLGGQFLIITFASALCAWYRDCVAMHRLESRCAGVVAIDRNFGSLEDARETNWPALVDLANKAIAERDADVAILAGAPLAGLATRARDQIRVPVIDPVAAAVKQAEALIALGTIKASLSSFRRPVPKASTGLSSKLAAYWKRRSDDRRINGAAIGPCDYSWPKLHGRTRFRPSAVRRRPVRASVRSPSTRWEMCMCCGAGSHLCSSSTRTVRSFVAMGRARYSFRMAFQLTAGIEFWIADRDAHQIVVFNLEGEPLLRIGERHVPRWMSPFNHPTRAAIAPDGEIYVADGYGNARIHRFSPEGEWRASFGELGRDPGEFMTPHSIIVDRENRLVVCDRENDRVQLFDRDGGWLAEWRGLCRPMDLCERDDAAASP